MGDPISKKQFLNHFNGQRVNVEVAAADNSDLGRILPQVDADGDGFITEGEADALYRAVDGLDRNGHYDSINYADPRIKRIADTLGQATEKFSEPSPEAKESWLQQQLNSLADWFSSDEMDLANPPKVELPSGFRRSPSLVKANKGEGVIRQGTAGSSVWQVQQRLVSEGLLEQADGQFDAATKSAVEAYQRRHNLGVDGKVGSETAGHMFADHPELLEKKSRTSATADRPQEAVRQAGDAWVAIYPDYEISTRDFTNGWIDKADLGHTDLVVFSDDPGGTRRATLHQFGRYETDAGEVRSQQLPLSLSVDPETGDLTEASRNELLAYLSEHHGKGGRVSATEVEHVDLDKVNNFVRDFRSDRRSGERKYNPFTNNCTTFAWEACANGTVSERERAWLDGRGRYQIPGHSDNYYIQPTMPRYDYTPDKEADEKLAVHLPPDGQAEI